MNMFFFHGTVTKENLASIKWILKETLMLWSNVRNRPSVTLKRNKNGVVKKAVV